MASSYRVTQVMPEHIYLLVAHFDCHPEQALLRRDGSGQAARNVAFFATARFHLKLSYYWDQSR